ncbi:MAG TPA: response regulator transcription factor [Candidatus Limnocylindrales bacterium]|nr:response regulator transcription factor [Candidatus Limnocylindrales bacterium]
MLAVEDDPEVLQVVITNLKAHGYRVEAADSAAAASRAWDAGRPDLVILDLGLPDRDGLTVIAQVRAEATTPILVISARGSESDRVLALDRGADDYLTKPFGLAELRARVGALLRRAGGPGADAEGRLRVGPVAMDVAAREVRVGGAAVDLTPREYELLKVLLSRAGTVVTRGRLLRSVWGVGYQDEAHYVHVYVNRLRRKLAAADPSGRAPAIIASEPGIGYRVRDPDG